MSRAFYERSGADRRHLIAWLSGKFKPFASIRQREPIGESTMWRSEARTPPRTDHDETIVIEHFAV
jgi:hypothetical protein